MQDLLSQEQIDAVVSGRHSNPFAVLGIHKNKGSKNIFIRAFYPNAKSIEIIEKDTNKNLGYMHKVHDHGLFQIEPECEENLRYYFKITNYDDSAYNAEDVYSFPATIGDIDVYLLSEGTHLEIYKKLGAHVREINGVKGVSFAVWAPNAQNVAVVGGFNNWDGRVHQMRKHLSCGVWDIFIPNINQGEVYKYEIRGVHGNILPLKTDPIGFYGETIPNNASVVFDIDNYEWNDKNWIEYRKTTNTLDKPVSIYEVHLGSWKRVPEDNNRYLSYREAADQLVEYVSYMGFTHVEFMPLTEYPFDGSWGYQTTGMFAVTSRFGNPVDLKYLIDKLHQANIGVIMDWVPAHFPKDENGLINFDGTALYEHEDPRKGEHMDWGTKIYNFGRNEVSNFLCSSANFWLKEYHIDALRVDAVASMLYLDYSKEDGQWVANEYGGNENLEAIAFIRKMNETVYTQNEGIVTCAEESTAWPMVSRPTDMGGLGFSYKWNMGWMNDTLSYIKEDPVHRKYHHGKLTFGLIYAFNENFILPISHDEVVHGKGSMLQKMPGDEWQKFANLRAYYSFMYTHPGKKLLFMGCEFGQDREWDYDNSLSWHLMQYPGYNGLKECVRDLNNIYRNELSLHEVDYSFNGFEWIEHSNADDSVISYVRKGKDPKDYLIVVCNFTPVVRHDYLIGVDDNCTFKEIFNSDDLKYWGSGVVNNGEIQSKEFGWNYKERSISVSVPPLATIILKPMK